MDWNGTNAWNEGEVIYRYTEHVQKLRDAQKELLH